MGLFTLDIEKLYEELEESGQQLKGIACIQYPIYCIHATITDNTTDPLDNLDGTIADFLVAKGNFTLSQIASFMGTSKGLIEMRIAKMIWDGLLSKNGNHYALTDLGFSVYRNKTQVRQHIQSYDFYIDGISLQPLPKTFYHYYSSKFISEYDSYYYTNAKGDTHIFRPFGPDLVHTPPDKATIIKNIFNIENDEREYHCIPRGLQAVADISFTRLSLQLLISVSSNGVSVRRQLIDGFAIYSLSDNMSYLDAVKKNVKIFDPTVKSKIENIIFKINIPRAKADRPEQPKPVVTTNWQEIDRYKTTENKCFSFSSEDLLKVIEQLFHIKHVTEESLVNSDREILININKKMLLSSSNRAKLVNDLIRRRDYSLGNPDTNAFLLYIYYKTSDDFVKRVVHYKKCLDNSRSTGIKLSWLKNTHPEFSQDYRQLSIAAGEFEVLERLDIEKYMTPIS